MENFCKEDKLKYYSISNSILLIESIDRIESNRRLFSTGVAVHIVIVENVLRGMMHRIISGHSRVTKGTTCRLVDTDIPTATCPGPRTSRLEYFTNLEKLLQRTSVFTLSDRPAIFKKKNPKDRIKFFQ